MFLNSTDATEYARERAGMGTDVGGVHAIHTDSPLTVAGTVSAS